MFTAVKQLQAEDPDSTLLLNAGDYFQGTMWFSKLGYEPVAVFGNLMNWTAMGLGNHDFDLGAPQLANFSKDANFTLLAANMEQNNADIDYKPSKVVEIHGRKIGIVGYVTTTTPNITAGDIPMLTFLDEIESVRKEAQRLKSLKPPVDIIIALGHSGYLLDLKMAKEIEEIDLVVGGHSHSFLYTGEPSAEMIEDIEGDFPTYVTQANGKVVPVVQVYKYSKYLGHLKLNFDNEGELMKPVNGTGVSKADVVTIDKRFEKDPWIEAKLDEYREKLEEFYPAVGCSNVLLEKIENEESNIGNIITDAMVQYSKWNDTKIAFYNNGGIRGTIDPGEITGEDVIQVLPFGSTFDRVTMKGSGIRGILEEYAAHLCANMSCHPPTFLQMSGLRVKYDIYPDTQTVTSIEEKCGKTWCKLNETKVYPVVLSSFLGGGGSFLYNFPDWIETQEKGDTDYPAFKQYVIDHTPINAKKEGRITINYYDTYGNIIERPEGQTEQPREDFCAAWNKESGSELISASGILMIVTLAMLFFN